MSNSVFHAAISAPRFQRYLLACGDHGRALQLYRANIDVSRQMYGVIGIFEVILRNSVDRHMTYQFGLKKYLLRVAVHCWRYFLTSHLALTGK
jgi:hypothetical protein